MPLMARSRVVWSEEQQRFVPQDAPAPRAPRATRAAPPAANRTTVQPRPPRRSGPPPVPPARAPRSAAVAPTAPRAPQPKPTKPPKPVKAPKDTQAAKPRRRAHWGRRFALLGLLGFLLIPLLFFLFAWYQFGKIERVDVADVLSPGVGGGTNYLIVGSDSREGIESDDPNAGAFIGNEVSGARTDTIMVLRLQGGSSKLLSIPRDLWVQNAVTGEFGRVNSTYQTSPAALIQTVQQSLGIPIQHYLEIDFLSFGDLVDAVGGITIDFEHPARDDKSGLLVEQTGPVTLNGEQALAYVRSRSYSELIDGTWQTDPTADIGRTERQRAFLTALIAELGSARNPAAASNIAGSLGGGVKIDNAMSFFDGLRLAWSLKGLSPESVELPVFGRTTTGGASVLELDSTAPEVLAQFGAGAP